MKLPKELVEKRQQVCAKGRFDPLYFAEKAWPWGVKGTALAEQDIRCWQSEVLDDIAQHLLNKETRYMPLRLAVASGHGIGKSAGMGMLTTWALSCWRDPRIVITANTEGQLRTKTSPEVGQWVRTSLFADLFDIDTLSIRLHEAPEQHRADFTPWSEQRPESIAGLHAKDRIVLVLMDEASAIPDIIWETIEGALTDENTVLIWVAFGNPTRNRGRFRECFRKNRKLWNTRQIDSRTVEGTNRRALDEIVEHYGEDSDTAKIRVKGQFPNASITQFIPTSYVDHAWGRHLRPEQYEFAPVILSCDPAWEGDDELIIAKRQGLHFEVLEVLEKNHNDIFIAAKLAHYEDKYEADAVFVDGGYGTGIISAGRTMGREWRIVWFAGAASEEGYKNKRAEMYSEVRQWLADGGSIPPLQRLYDDLIAQETKPHTGGIIQLQGKVEMKKEGMPSPDHSDALALTFAYPVMKKPKATKEMSPPQSRASVVKEEVFDPHGD